MKFKDFLESTQQLSRKEFLDWVVDYMHRGIDTGIVYLDISRQLDLYSLHSNPGQLNKSKNQSIVRSIDVKMGDPDFWTGVDLQIVKSGIQVNIKADIAGEERNKSAIIMVPEFSQIHIWSTSEKINRVVGDFLDRLDDEFRHKYPDLQ